MHFKVLELHKSGQGWEVLRGGFDSVEISIESSVIIKPLLEILKGPLTEDSQCHLLSNG